MKHFVVDIETNGQNPLGFSMISLGAVLISEGRRTGDTFYGELCPRGSGFEPQAYAVNGFTHEQAKTFSHPSVTMHNFLNWVEELRGDDKRIIFVSDNAGFDWQFVNAYLWLYTGKNPFGHSPMSLTWYFKGKKGIKSSFQDYRKKVSPIAHTHNALDDAMGNSYALEALLQEA